MAGGFYKHIANACLHFAISVCQEVTVLLPTVCDQVLGDKGSPLHHELVNKFGSLQGWQLRRASAAISTFKLRSLAVN